MYKRRKSRIAIQFATKEEYDKYMKQHPDADKRNHSVKEKKNTNKHFTQETKNKARKLDISDSSKSSGGKLIHQKQISDNDLITFIDKDGVLQKNVKVGKLTPQQREQVFKALDSNKFIYAKDAEGFSDYSKVDLTTFKNNMQSNLQYLSDKNIKLNINTRQTPVSERLDGFLKQNRQNLEKVIAKYSSGIKSQVSRTALFGKQDENGIKTQKGYVDVLQETIRQACSKGGGLQHITQQQLDAYLQQDMKRLIYQQVQTRRRSMGDHGIRHLVGNAVNSVDILNKLQDGGININGKDKLLSITAMVNHDIGYTLGQVALNAAKGGFHKSYSGLIALEQSSRYQKIFGEDGMKKLVGTVQTYSNGKPVLSRQVDMVRDGKQIYETGKKLPNGKDELTDDVTKAKGYTDGKPKKASQWKDYTEEQAYDQKGKIKLSQKQYQDCKIKHVKGEQGVIQYHDSSNYDWKKDPVGSAIALSDCTALFGKDKVQQFFYKNQKAMEDVTKMQMIMLSDLNEEQKSSMFNHFKQKMYKHINSLQDATIADKNLLISQIKQMQVGKFSTVQDILTRSSGVLQGFEYDRNKNQVIVNTTYSEQGNVLQNMFGSDLARDQWSKLYKDIRGSGQIRIDNKGNQVLFKGDQNNSEQSKILIKINGFTGTTFGSSGVAQVYKNIMSYPVKQQITRLNESILSSLQSGMKYGQKALKKLANLQFRLTNEKTESGKAKGQQIFGSNWDTVKQLMKKARQGIDVAQQLKNLGLSEQQKAYLLGSFRTSSLKRFAMNMAKQEYVNRLAKQMISSDELKKYSIKFNKLIVYWFSNGEVQFLIDNHMYRCFKRYKRNEITKILNDNQEQLQLLKNELQLKNLLDKLIIKNKRVF